MQVEERCCEYALKNKNAIPGEHAFPEIHLQSIDSIIKEEGYVKYEVSKQKIPTNGNSYLGELYEVNIKGETVKGNKETNIFVKIIIPVEANKIISISEAYYKECYTYNELSKIFTELQNEVKVPVKERFNMAKSYVATSKEAIFLENLAKRGFTTLHRMSAMPLEFAEAAIQHLAKFHGLFYVLQRKRPSYFNSNLRVMQQPVIFNEDWREFISHMSNLSSAALTGDEKQKVEDFIPKIFDKYLLYMQDTSSAGCTICHGDYRVNNILMKNTNGELTEVIPVDYQLLYYGCPIYDLLYLLFTASDQEFRRNHLNDLKNLYYDHLEKFLGYFDLDVSDIYPRKEFERQYKERLDIGLMFALYITPFLFTKDEHVPDIGKDDMTKLGFVLDERCRERIQGIVDDFIQWGYL